MENPNTWTPTQKIIASAIQQHQEYEARGVIGHSLVKSIYRALVEHDLIKSEYEVMTTCCPDCGVRMSLSPRK